jgi:DNA-binding MarR family transcriptional regulator
VDDVLNQIDDTIHVKVRLAIMSILTAEGSVTFTRLKDRLRLTDGNLAAHLRALETARYVAVHKSFVARRPRTTVELTERGRAAFRDYVTALENLIRMGRERDQHPDTH